LELWTFEIFGPWRDDDVAYSAHSSVRKSGRLPFGMGGFCVSGARSSVEAHIRPVRPSSHGWQGSQQHPQERRAISGALDRERVRWRVGRSLYEVSGRTSVQRPEPPRFWPERSGEPIPTYAMVTPLFNAAARPGQVPKEAGAIWMSGCSTQGTNQPRGQSVNHRIGWTGVGQNMADNKKGLTAFAASP